MKSVGIVACSDAQKPEWKEQNQTLIHFLEKAGNKVFVSNCIYEKWARSQALEKNVRAN